MCLVGYSAYDWAGNEDLVIEYFWLLFQVKSIISMCELVE